MVSLRLCTAPIHYAQLVSELYVCTDVYKRSVEAGDGACRISGAVPASPIRSARRGTPVHPSAPPPPLLSPRAQISLFRRHWQKATFASNSVLPTTAAKLKQLWVCGGKAIDESVDWQIYPRATLRLDTKGRSAFGAEWCFYFYFYKSAIGMMYSSVHTQLDGDTLFVLL